MRWNRLDTYFFFVLSILIYGIVTSLAKFLPTELFEKDSSGRMITEFLYDTVKYVLAVLLPYVVAKKRSEFEQAKELTTLFKGHYALEEISLLTDYYQKLVVLTDSFRRFPNLYKDYLYVNIHYHVVFFAKRHSDKYYHSNPNDAHPDAKKIVSFLCQWEALTNKESALPEKTVYQIINFLHANLLYYQVYYDFKDDEMTTWLQKRFAEKTSNDDKTVAAINQSLKNYAAGENDSPNGTAPLINIYQQMRQLSHQLQAACNGPIEERCAERILPSYLKLFSLYQNVITGKQPPAIRMLYYTVFLAAFHYLNTTFKDVVVSSTLLSTLPREVAKTYQAITQRNSTGKNLSVLINSFFLGITGNYLSSALGVIRNDVEAVQGDEYHPLIRFYLEQNYCQAVAPVFPITTDEDAIVLNNLKEEFQQDKQIREINRIVTLCRNGMFASATEFWRKTSLDDVRLKDEYKTIYYATTWTIAAILKYKSEGNYSQVKEMLTTAIRGARTTSCYQDATRTLFAVAVQENDVLTYRNIYREAIKKSTREDRASCLRMLHHAKKGLVITNSFELTMWLYVRFPFDRKVALKETTLPEFISYQ